MDTTLYADIGSGMSGKKMDPGTINKRKAEISAWRPTREGMINGREAESGKQA